MRTNLKIKPYAYPPQIGAYAVEIKHEQSTHNWTNFAMARLQISVGQESHEGAKMKATAEWVSHRFHRTQVCVDDTLQRFNFMFAQDLSEKTARMVAEDAGTLWIERNLPFLSAIPNIEIVRWDTWLNEPGFAEARAQVEWLHINNAEFRSAIEDNILAFWQRRKSKDPVFYAEDRFEKFASTSRGYLLEETAAFSLMFEKDKAIDLYPGTVLLPVTLFQNKTVEGAPAGLGKGHFCRIGFARNKNAVLQDNSAQQDQPQQGKGVA